MAEFLNFQPLLPDEECLQANNAMSRDGGTACADDGISLRIRQQQQQQSSESHSAVLSPIGNYEQAGDSDVLDREEDTDARESGILVRFVEGDDMMYGAPNACSTGLSFLQPEIMDTLNSLVRNTRKEHTAGDTASGFPGYSTTGSSPLSQYAVNSSSSAESLSQHSFMPRASGVGDSFLSAVGAGQRNMNRREAAVGMCSSEDTSRQVKNLQRPRVSEGNFNESRWCRSPTSSEASSESTLSQHPCGSHDGDTARLSEYPMSDVSGLIQDFDALIQGSAGGDIKASHLTVVDAFPGVVTSVALPQFTVVDAYVGDTEAGGSKTELPQFTIVDTFVDENSAQRQSSSFSGQRWVNSQFDVVDAVVGSLRRDGEGEEHSWQEQRIVTAECRTLEIVEGDDLRLERLPLHPLKSFETCKTQGVSSVAELHRTAALETYTYKDPLPGTLQQVNASSAARSATCSVTTLPESGDCQLYASSSVAKPAMFPASQQLMSGDMSDTVAASSSKSTAIPASLQLMSGDLPQTSAGVTPHLESRNQSEVIARPDSNYSTPRALRQPLASNVSHSNSAWVNRPSSVQSANVDLSFGAETLRHGNEIGNLPDGASHFLPPRIPVVQEPELREGGLPELQKKQVWMPLQLDQETSDFEKTLSPLENDGQAGFNKPLDSLLPGYQNLQWMTLKAGESQAMSDLVSPHLGLPFDINRTDNSLRLSMDMLQMSIGDTLVHTGRAPLGSSTPIAKEDRLTVRRLQAMQTIQDSEERSDSGRASRSSTAVSGDPEMEPGKTEAKSGSDVEYMPAEEWLSLLKPNIHHSSEKERAGDGGYEGWVAEQNDANGGRARSIIDETAETEDGAHTMQNRSKGVGQELNVRDAVVREKVEDQRNVEMEWVEKQSGRRSRTASSSGCSLGDSAPDYKAPTEPVPRAGICDRLSDRSDSFEDLRLTYKRKEPLGEEGKDAKQSSQAFAKAVEAKGGYEDSEKDSCSEGSDVENVHRLYLSCLRGDEDEGTSEEEENEEREGDGVGEKQRDQQDEMPGSKNLTMISESSREDLSRVRPSGSLHGAQQKPDVKPARHGGSAVVVSDTDSMASSLPRSSRSGSDIEDGLSEDVKRILAKYGRRFSSRRSDDAERLEDEMGYTLNDGKLDQPDSRPLGKSDDKPFAKSENETSGNGETCISDRTSKSDRFHPGDVPDRVSTVSDGPSKICSENAENSIPKHDSGIRASTLRRLAEQTVESSGESSDDTLGRRVNDLLTKTDRFLERKSEVAEAEAESPGRRSSVASSQTGCVDYGVLQRDLDELEMSLDSMKKGGFVSHFPEPRAEKAPLTQSVSGAEISRTGTRGLHMLLTSGLVPVDLVLDMVHGCTDDLSDDGGTGASDGSLGREGASVTGRDTVMARFNEEALDDKSHFTEKDDAEMEQNRCMSNAFAPERAVTTPSGLGVSQSCLTGEDRSRSLEAAMDDWSQSHISSFPEMSALVNDDGSRSRGSFLENVTTQRGSSQGLRFNNVSQRDGLRDSVDANVTIGRGSNSFRESVTKNLSSSDVGQSSEMGNVGRGVTDVKENQSSGYSDSGSLPRTDLSLGFGVVAPGRMTEPSQPLAGGRPLTSTDWNVGKVLRPVQGSVSPTERTVELKIQSEMKRNQTLNENIDKHAYFRLVGSGKSDDRGGKGDARTSTNLVSGHGRSLNSQSCSAGGAPFDVVFQPDQSKGVIRDSDVAVPQQRTSCQDDKLSSIQKRCDDSEQEELSHNESSFSGSGINNNENNLRATPVSDIHQLDSFEDSDPISAVKVHRASLKHDRAEFTAFDCELHKGEWTEQFLDVVEPDYLSESLQESSDDPLSSDLSGSFVISPLRRHSPFRASKSVQLLLAAQLNRAKASSHEVYQQPLKHTVIGDAHHEGAPSFGRDIGDDSGDSTLLVDDSAVTTTADETLKPVTESFKERSELKHDDNSPSDHDEQSGSSAMQHTSLTTVTSLRDSTDCENNLILEFPTRRDNRPASTSPTIVPYRPANSRDVYYVDSGTDDGSVSAGHSEATVESTHAGSDDARAPNFPADVLGTRSDAPMDAMRSVKTMPSSVSRPTDLSTIEEFSTVQTSSSDRRMSDNSIASKSNHLMEKSRKKEFEQSLEKTKNWVIGISSSLPDMCTPMKAHRTSLGSLSDSNVPRDGQATTIPEKPSNIGSGPPPTHNEQLGKAGDGAGLPSKANEAPGIQPKKRVVERASKGVAMSSDIKNISVGKGLPLSRAAQESRPNDEHLCEPCSMPAFGSNRDKSSYEPRSGDFEENAATERRVDPTLKPDLCHQSITASSALDRFVSDRFAGRFESHYGLMPGVQSIVEQYADGKDTEKRRLAEDELNRTRTMHESTFRSHKDFADAAAGESVLRGERVERMDLHPSKSLDSSLKNMAESNANHVSKSRSSTLPGEAMGEVSMENSERLPQSSSRISKDAFVSRLWEKFHESGESGSSESESGSRRAEARALQLVSLVKNPVKHIVKHMQREREEHGQAIEGHETVLDRSRSRIDEGTSLRSAESYETYVMDAGKPWDLAREAAADKDGDRPSGSYNGHGTTRKGAGDQSSGLVGRNGGGGRGVMMSGAGEKSSSDDEQAERRRKLVHGDYGKAEVLKKLLEKEEREKREEGRGAASGHHHPRPQGVTSKRAWIIQDEVLPVVPENRTIDSVTSEFTSSSVDESGKIVTRTSKRNLPNDPRLLKLQQKIARQKEKYKQAYTREHRRKAKIAQMELLYLAQQSEVGIEPTRVGSSLDSFSQPPSVAFDSTPQNVTSDNSAFCFECSETDGSGCVCVRLRSKHPALQKSLPEEMAHGMKMRTTSPNKRRGGRSAPSIALDLREVDYSEDDRGRKEEFVRTGRARESHLRNVASPKGSGKVASRNGSPRKMTRASPERKTPSFVVPKESSAMRDNPSSSVQRKLKSKSVDFGMNFPTPRPEIRKSSRSKGVQTTPRLEEPELDARSCVSERRPYRGSRPYDVGVISIPVRGRVNVKTHRTSVHEWHQQTRSSVRSHKVKPRKPFPRGIAWFVPLSKTASSKSPQPQQFTDLYERYCDTLSYTRMVRDDRDKENTIHLDHSSATIVKDSSTDFVGHTTLHKDSVVADVLRENAKNFQKLTPSEIHPTSSEGFVFGKGASLGPPLQELFRSNMQAFISRSRKRERHIALRAEERRIQELHAKERLELFGSASRGSSVLHTDSVSERLFKPRKRWFTKQQMKMMTNKRYRNLPEVMKQVEQRQKTEWLNANRQKVQMFKQKILTNLLSEKNRRTAT